MPFIWFSISSKEVATLIVQSKPDLEGFYESTSFHTLKFKDIESEIAETDLFILLHSLCFDTI